MPECKEVVEQVPVSAEEEAFVERVREVLEEALERLDRKRCGLVEPPPDLHCSIWMRPIDILRELTIALPTCGPEFYKRCDFDRLIRICPFDPAWEAFEWKQKLVSERLEALEVQVKELQA